MNIKAQRLFSDPGASDITSAYLLTAPNGVQAVARRDINRYGPEWKLFQIETHPYGGLRLEWGYTTDSLWYAKELFAHGVADRSWERQPGVPRLSKQQAIDHRLW